jgi:antitoxin component YwqK of YwqJK toxin-antitoxin module
MQTVITISFLLSFIQTYSQNQESNTTYSKLDTLITYNVSLKAETGSGYAKYYVNESEVRKIVYDSYKKFWDNIEKCTPCYLKSYDEDDSLMSESVQFTDCGVGIWIEYYKNGILKEKGQFKENHTGNWSNIYARGFCEVKVGEWKYFDEKGKLLKVEHYKDGILIK